MSEPFSEPGDPSKATPDVLWRIFDIHKASMASVGRSQSRFVTTLLGFLAVLWGWHFMKPASITIQFMGASLSPSGLWMIAPAVLTALALSIIGAINVMGTVWKRLRDAADNLELIFFWTDLDTNKNIIDYLTFLKFWPEGAVEPTEPPTDNSRKFKLAVFSYPAVLAGCLATTLLADYPGSPKWVKAYVYGCGLLQAVYSFRLWYRAVCRFFAIRRPQTEI